jgi:hypothetical protein
MHIVDLDAHAPKEIKFINLPKEKETVITPGTRMNRRLRRALKAEARKESK